MKGEVGIYPIENQHLPSVTSILEYALGLHNSLLDWATKKGAMKMYDELLIAKKTKKRLTKEACVNIALSARQDILKDAQNKGKIIHSAIQQTLELGTAEVPDEYQNHYGSFTDWLEKNPLTPIMMEQLVWDLETGYAGRLDCYAQMGDERVLIDFKTSNTIRPEYGLQLVAYKHALEQMGFRVDRTFVLHIQEDKVQSIQFSEHFDTFLAVKKIFDWKVNANHPNYYNRGDIEALKQEIQLLYRQKELDGQHLQVDASASR